MLYMHATYKHTLDSNRDTVCSTYIIYMYSLTYRAYLGLVDPSCTRIFGQSWGNRKKMLKHEDICCS